MREKIKQLRHPIRTLIGVVAVFLSVTATTLLIVEAVLKGTVWHVVSFSIYGASLVALWTMSTLYHSLNVSREAEKTLNQIDHAMIYFLIAGTYTPICLVVLQGGWGWSLFGINWALAIAGMVLKLVFRRPKQWVVVLLFSFYIVMGWLVVIAWFPLARVFPQEGIFWLVIGGIFYTAGAIILAVKRLNFTPQFGAHEIWHLFVLVGSFCHFWMMLRYVLYLNS